MRVHLISNSLARWDELERIPALVLSFFDDERPLRGAAGLADWRLCGRLSRLIRQGRVTGQNGETLMMPPGRRLGFERLMLFGLGHSKEFTEDVFRQRVRVMHAVACKAGVKGYAIQPPGRATGAVGARRALELLLAVAEQGDGGIEDLHVIDTEAAHREMSEVLRYRRDDSSTGKASSDNDPAKRQSENS